MPVAETEVDVLIVGGGPVGLTARALLAAGDAAANVVLPWSDSYFAQLGFVLGVAYDNVPAEPSLEYVPTMLPGHRMPYLPLSSGRSTLDAIGEWFTVFTVDPDGWAQQTGSWPVRVETLTGVHDIGPHGALLVRPDGHIAARWTELPTDEKVVHRALAAVAT